MIKSKRREYFACHLTKEVRKQLKEEAKSQGKSMSALAAEFITAALGGTSKPIVELSEVDVPLPFMQEQ